MQINVFAVIHTDVTAKVMKAIAVLVVPDIQQKYAVERGEIQFTKQNVSSSVLRKTTIYCRLSQIVNEI